VQALDGDAEGAEVVHERVEVLAVGIGAQQRVAEHARRERLGAHAFLGGPALRRLGEIEELVPGHGPVGVEGSLRHLRPLQVLRHGDDYVRATFEWVAQQA